MADKENGNADFAATLDRLEMLVGQLESGELTLEASLAAFEQGVRLTRDAQKRLDEAELKVRALIERPDGSLDEVPFESPSMPPEAGNDR
ncbi:exodeoxyribonuclease VII small subunit [Modicisalibacter xianhensis]|uniref:Exodeoxyribonuclease 7 small subunit n=1 Tax=Modicisalibacter xianhensis TaxID=442341 RepID=A0A4R8G0X5_9GAMM|nr:exodeoxyribonuclease VII small subunit [Halomonas xianhensis]TDX28712.1 exodeoxyribonuclease VII small subunit [Halomonas xianhensis]